MQGARPRVGGAHQRRALEACGLVVGLWASGLRQGDAELGEAALDVHGPHECRSAGRTDRGQQRGGERPCGQERGGAAEHCGRMQGVETRGHQPIISTPNAQGFQLKRPLRTATPTERCESETTN